MRICGGTMIIVSACLAGVQCRYNGQEFPIPEVVEMVKKGQAIPVCPEVLGGLPIPRPKAEQRAGRILCENGQDVTHIYEAGAEKALQIARLLNCEKAILKSKSPTCGCGMIYDGTFSGKLIDGDGIFCTLLKKAKISVHTENEIF